MSSGGKRGLAKIPSAEASPREDGRSSPVGQASATGWQSARSSPEAVDWMAGPSGELLMAAVRGALREELLAFFGDSTACKSGPSSQSFVQNHLGKFDGVSPSEAGASLKQVGDEGEISDQNMRAQYFASFTHEYPWGQPGGRQSHGSVNSVRELAKSATLDFPYSSVRKSVWLLFVGLMTDLWNLHEPERTGLLANFVRSYYFERGIQIVILCNIVVMGLAANYEISHVPTLSDDQFHTVLEVLDIIFQVIYTVELLLKLAVHRLYFFWNDDAGFNSFDMFLVISGYVELLFKSGGGSTALRTVRVLKLGKALRALKVIAGFRTLRAILVCIQGSFVTLLWSAVMLCLVFYIFSLIFVQQAASRLQQIRDPQDPESLGLLDMFDSVGTSMLTLSKASFGGEDWGVALDVLQGCGAMTGFFYMLFISFSQIALINIITGIFVDNAMQSLTPNREQLAMRLDEEERGYAKELERLCIAVDADQSGCLTKEQFRDGLLEGRIPLLLQLLGLNRDSVQLFFEILCDAAPDKQVDIKNFVRGCMRLKGAATSFDLQTLMSDLRKVERKITNAFRDMDRRMASVEQGIGSGGPPVGRPSWTHRPPRPGVSKNGISLSPRSSKAERPGEDEADPL